MINVDTFKVIHGVFKKLQKYQETCKRGEFTYSTRFHRRNNEYVFAIDMFYVDSNFKMQEYTCVFFNDSDDGKADVTDFERPIEEIDKFTDSIRNATGEHIFFAPEKECDDMGEEAPVKADV